MACKRMMKRELRRKRLSEKYFAMRKELKGVIASSTDSTSSEDFFAAQEKLAALPRDASPVRIRNRCQICGRPRGVVSKFRLCRIHLREYAMKGFIPGLRMSSW